MTGQLITRTCPKCRQEYRSIDNGDGPPAMCLSCASVIRVRPFACPRCGAQCERVTLDPPAQPGPFWRCTRCTWGED